MQHWFITHRWQLSTTFAILGIALAILLALFSSPSTELETTPLRKAWILPPQIDYILSEEPTSNCISTHYRGNRYYRYPTNTNFQLWAAATSRCPITE